MGTLAAISWSPIVGANSNLGAVEIARILRDRCDDLNQLMSRFIPDSEVSRLGSQWLPLSPDTAAVIETATQYRDRTDRFFDPLLGKQTQQPGADLRDPSPHCALPGESNATIEKDGAMFRLVGAESGSVDLGAIAKGYAADKLCDQMKELGANDVLVSLGGSSIAVAGQPAKIGITSPWVDLERIGTLTVSASMSMSADHAVTVTGGRHRSNVVDPHTGAPAFTDLAAVIVCARDGMACEAFSTAFLAMGLDSALQIAVRELEIRCVFLTVDGRVLADPRLEFTMAPGVQAWLQANRPS